MLLFSYDLFLFFFSIIFPILALFAAVYSDNVDLFHGTLQSQSPSLLRPTKDTRVPESATPINLAPANEGEFLDGKEYVPYRASRHDEFDWALTKVKRFLPGNKVIQIN